MCGRYLLHADPKLIERAFGAEFSQIPRELVPRWNIAPTQHVPIVRNQPGRELTIVRQGEGRGRELVTVRWGLIPAWAKDPAIGNRMINARAEGVADKPAFRSAFRVRRCIVPASGFYEWHRQGRGPQAALPDPAQGWRADRLCGPVGELAGPGHRQGGRDLHDYHLRAQRADG